VTRPIWRQAAEDLSVRDSDGLKAVVKEFHAATMRKAYQTSGIGRYFVNRHVLCVQRAEIVLAKGAGEASPGAAQEDGPSERIEKMINKNLLGAAGEAVLARVYLNVWAHPDAARLEVSATDEEWEDHCRQAREWAWLRFCRAVEEIG